MMTAESDYRKILRNELDSRCQKTPRYSLRAFARELGLSPARLSEVLSGKQGISREVATGIAVALGMDSPQSEIFCDLVDAEHARSRAGRELAKLRLEKRKLEASIHTIELDAFQAVSDWYHMALFLLIKLPNFKNDLDWIARALEISPDQAKSALQRLIRLGLVKKGGSRLTALDSFVATPDGIPSSAIRRFHKQILERALDALESQSVEERNISSVMVQINKKQLKDAAKWIKSFRRRFCQRINGNARSSAQATDVYCLAIQFFNLSPNKENCDENDPQHDPNALDDIRARGSRGWKWQGENRSIGK